MASLGLDADSHFAERVDAFGDGMDVELQQGCTGL